MAIGISPLVDYAFKLMLGSPEHSGITMHFLNAVLVGQPRITQVTFLNPILNKESDDDKLAVLDILATDEHGRRLNIEMQTSVPAGMPERLTYYAAASYAGQLSEGQSYQKLLPSISICVLSRALFSRPPLLHLDFRLRDFATSLTLTDDLQVHLLQLKHLQITSENVYNATPAEQWAFFLANAETMTIADVLKLVPDKVFREAFGVLEMISQTAEQMLAYNARLKYQRDEEARLLQARLDGLDEGRQKGLEEGVEIGKARGVEIGQLRGRVALLQELLGRPVWAASEFAACDEAQLKKMAEQLEEELRIRES
jgi:predicted transposase/invertase (TIGR01784 family)